MIPAMGSLDILIATHYLIAPLAIGHILIFKQEPRGAYGWIATCILLPVGGPVLYCLFGVNRIRSRAKKMAERGHSALALENVRRSANGSARAPEELRALDTASSRITGLPLVEGNDIELLVNGDQAFPAMLDAIRSSEHSVWMTVYILRADSVGRRFCEELVAAAQRGVDVRLVLDGVGCLLSWWRIRRWLDDTPVKVVRFVPPSLVPPSLYVNLRNHRKLLLVDGATAFVGGMNINASNLHKAKPRKPIQDLHFRILGPLLADLAAVFAEEWEFITGESLEHERPVAAAPVGDALCRVIADGPSLEQDRLATLLFSAIAVARESIVIVTPYFLPSRELTAALAGAALRGVDVTVIIPEKLDRHGPQWARSKVLPPLLERGVSVLKQPAPFAHSKLLVVDSRYALIGSANIDPRSLRLNFELGVEIYESEAVTRIALHCDDLIQKSRPVTREALAARPLPVKLRDAVAWLASPYM